MICSETAVVAPLETLNTNLNYKILDDFIGKITDSTTKFFTPTSVNDYQRNDSDENTITPSLLPKINPFSLLFLLNISIRRYLFFYFSIDKSI